MAHSPTSATGTGWERTPWHATQRAAWEALGKENGAMMRLALVVVLLLASVGMASAGVVARTSASRC
jgi:uncharacterized membrane protein